MVLISDGNIFSAKSENDKFAKIRIQQQYKQQSR